MKSHPPRLLTVAMVVLVLFLVGASAASATGAAGPFAFGMMGGGPGNMMNGSGQGGMMHGAGSVGVMPGWGTDGATGASITITQARRDVQAYLTRIGNPKLAIDEILEFQHNFYAIIKDTSSGHGAIEVLVNKRSGSVFPEYGPSMMWNTEYGAMRGGMGSMMGYSQPTGPMTVSATRAQQIARTWLARHRPGATAEAPDQFPGYYTVHFLKDSTVAGMLSINGYTGQVWFHTWHGTFIRSLTVDG